MCVRNKETPGLKMRLRIASCERDAEYSHDKAGLVEVNGYNAPQDNFPRTESPQGRTNYHQFLVSAVIKYN